MSCPHLSFATTDDFFDLDETQKNTYAILGRLHSYLASYEFECDELIFRIAELYPEFTKKNRIKPPFGRDKERRNFILKALSELERLKNLSDSSGPIDVSYISFAMEKIWYHRNNLTHGNFLRSHQTDSTHLFSLTRWQRDEEAKDTFHRHTYDYDKDLFNSILRHASYLKSMLIEAQLQLADRG